MGRREPVVTVGRAGVRKAQGVPRGFLPRCLREMMFLFNAWLLGNQKLLWLEKSTLTPLLCLKGQRMDAQELREFRNQTAEARF